MKPLLFIRKTTITAGAGALLLLGLSLSAQAELPAETRISKTIADQLVQDVSGVQKAAAVKRITDKLQRRYEKLIESQAAHRSKIRECAARKWTRRQQQIAGCTDGMPAMKCQTKLMQRCLRGTRAGLLSAKTRFLDTVDRDMHIIRNEVEAIKLR